jgi:hypothetical protein
MSRKEDLKIKVRVLEWKVLNWAWLLVFTFLVMVLMMGKVSAKEFQDVGKNHDNYAAISYLNEQGILTGYEDGSFKPAQLVNRAEVVKIILEGLKISGEVNEADLSSFPDVTGDEWFARYVLLAKQRGIVAGNADGNFAPARTVIRAELMKMLANAVNLNIEKWQGQSFYKDVPVDAWFNPFMNYAGKAGLITADAENKLYPERELNRGEVAEIIYLLVILKNAGNNEFLLEQAGVQMSLIDGYVDNKQIAMAKRSAELAVDMTQQALKNTPENVEVLAEAKLARSYDYLISSYILALQNNFAQAMEMSTMAILKADEATQASISTQSTAIYLKDSAEEIQSQLVSN